MKKTFLVAMICAITATSPLFGQHMQSLSFSGPSMIDITTTNTFTLTVDLTYSPYSSPGFSYWLEVQNALAPFLTVIDVNCFTFQCPPPPAPTPIPFNSGGKSGYTGETYDFGGTVNPNMPVPPGTYHVTDITFMLAPGTPLGMYDLRTTTTSPYISEVADTDFNDNPLPVAHFTINIVPEPSTLALLVLAAIVAGLVAHRRYRTFRVLKLPIADLYSGEGSNSNRGQ